MSTPSTEDLCILHLSDLHFSPSKQLDQRVVINALIKDLLQQKDNGVSPHLIIFSGDLVNNPDDEFSYDGVLEELFFKLFDSLSLDEKSLFIVPGNHDIHRSAVRKQSSSFQKKIDDIQNRDSLNAFYHAHKSSDEMRERSLGFFQLRQQITSPYETASNYFYESFVLPELNLALLCINSSWASMAGDRDDYGKLLFPEHALNEAFDAIPPSLTTVVIGHHPFEWFAEHCSNDLRDILYRKAHLFLCGHIHNARPAFINNSDGQLVLAQSGALYERRDRFNGYSLIRHEPEGNHLEFSLRSYFDRRRQFDQATDIAKNGKYYATPDAKAFWSRANRRPAPAAFAKWIVETVAPEIKRVLDEGLSGRPTSELFVPPRMLLDPPTSLSVYDDDHEDQEILFSEFCRSKANYFIIGNPEYGKSTLLRQTAISYLSGTNDPTAAKLPIFIDFDQIKPGRDVIVRHMRGFLPDITWERFTLRELLTDGLCVILVDDVRFSDRKRLFILYEFLREFPLNRYIFTSTRENNVLSELMPTAKAAAPIPFTALFLSRPSRYEIRQLVKKWPSQFGGETDKILDRLFQTIVYINVPITAVNATILLSIFENEPDFKPINQAVLIERFIELLLDKQNLTEALRGSFDFRNKVHFLSVLAHKMVMGDLYRIPYEDALNFAADYLKLHGFVGKPKEIIDSFCAVKVLEEKDGEVRFRYRAFLEFFTAKKLEDDAVFREFVFGEEHYLKFVNEIEYFAALRRDPIDLLNMLGERFLALDRALGDEVEWDRQLDTLDGLTLQRSYESAESIYSEIEAEIRAPKADEEERDALLEGALPRDIGERQEVYRPLYTDVGQKWMAALVLYSGVLRNCELIEDASKRKHLSNVLHGWGMLVLQTFVLVPALVKHRHFQANGVDYHVLFPSGMNDSEVAMRVYLSIPRAISDLVKIYLGSEKLQIQLSDSSLEDSMESGIIKMLKKGLYADLKLDGYIKQLETLEEELRNKNYLYQALAWKNKDFMRTAALTDAEHSKMQQLVAKMVERITPGSRKKKLDAKQREIGRLKRRFLIQRLKSAAQLRGS